ncbi:hypothetical protein B0E45_31820 [Sinorhizobium sp. A49]|uniref:hypothetical protein n=1 Tax=Sinorhizobium sp. A49 TaxID=1945861 RepID=UPI000985CC52|nr:hypothetical protein [Sinorhizobium sp. A49]OOG61996.1 hypothetical protein B0E45_31820 [Sinorhizobium sp. A49]
MYRIDSMYNPMIEALQKAVASNQTERWMASVAWWLGRQQICNAQDYWFKVAGKITASLPAVQRAALESQLGKAEDAYVDNPVAEWPEVPSDVANYIAAWDPEPAEPDLCALKADAIARIDREAERYRLNFITGGSGQTMAYQQKLAESRAAIAGPPAHESEIAHIVAEAALDGVSVAAKAAEIIATFEQWQIVSAGIEVKRLGAKKAVAAAETAAAVNAAAHVDWVEA